MKPEKWKKVKEILEQVLELKPSDRENYLKKLDLEKEILKEVEILLKAETESEEFLTASAGIYYEEIEETREENPIIQKEIGIYRIIEELGIGGMGAVYLAQRTDGKFEQKVAIKMLKREYNTEKIRELFRREREIQAKLTHTNIVNLLDAGSTDDGIPYLVMEYIEGIQIDKFCQQENLSLDERLKLFNKVCETVSFAHQNLIVHRDLKPSNILVAEKREPKLLDFGISKILSADKQISQTTTNFVAMTPEYASPEQIKKENLTTATDVYSLGVILFKLLTNSHPFNAENKTDIELLKEISEESPTLPSKAITFESKGKIEKTNILSSQLKGDLDNIILKSLRKEPERRYRTVESFANDIWRYIDGMPVKARPNTLSYRAKKFFGRNKLPVITGVLTIIGLITGISIALWQASVAREQARIAEAESIKSKEEEERAEEISKFMAKIISFANPAAYAEGYESNGQAKIIDVINELSDKIEADFYDRKDISSELHHKFAEVYLMLARYNINNKLEYDKFLKKAQFHSRRALQLRKEFYGEKHELVAKDLYYLASSGAEGEKGGIKLIAQAIKMMRKTNPNNPNFPQMLNSYAPRLHGIVSKELQGLYFIEANPPPNITPLELAKLYHMEALSIFQKQHSENHFFVTLEHCNIAWVMAKQNKLEELKPHFEICQNAAKLNYKEARQKSIERQIETINEVIQKK